MLEFDLIIVFTSLLVEFLQVLVCGDIRGNLVLFPLRKGVLQGTEVASNVKISPSNYFKGAHGISSVSSVSVGRLSSSQIEIRSVCQISTLIYKSDLALAF